MTTNGVGSSQTATDNTQLSTSNSMSEIADPQMFLKLLVAQIKYQDPLNPTDAVQYVTQLSQFSSLEQLIGIRQDVATLAGTSETGADTTGQE